MWGYSEKAAISKSEKKGWQRELNLPTRLNLNFYPPELKKKKKQTKFKPPSLQYFIMAALTWLLMKENA